MAQDQGASVPDRAATPSEPSPAVSGVAGIPCAESLFKLNDVMDCLRLLYRYGVNDGLRDGLGKPKLGEDRCIQEAADHLVRAIDAARGQ